MVNYFKIWRHQIRRWKRERKQIPKSIQKEVNPLVILSYPKSGRTWLRVILHEFDLPYKVSYTHQRSDIRGWTHWETFKFNPKKYKGQKVILVVREPKDTVVSFFFQATKRERIYYSSISKFIKHNYLGFKKILKFHEAAKKLINYHSDNYVMRYEQMKANPFEEIKAIANFLGIELTDRRIEEIIKKTSFDTMRKTEFNNAKNGKTDFSLMPGNIKDAESYKVRKGQVGGYVNYLSAKDIDWCNEQMENMVNPFYPIKKEEKAIL